MVIKIAVTLLGAGFIFGCATMFCVIHDIKNIYSILELFHSTLEAQNELNKSFNDDLYNLKNGD